MALTEVNVAKTNSNVASITTTAVTVAAGSVLVAATGIGGNVAVGTVKDQANAANWTNIASLLAHAFRCGLFITKLANGLSSQTITYTPGASGDQFLWVVQVTNGNSAAGVNNALGGQTTSTPSTGAITPGSGDTVVAAYYWNSTSATWTSPPTGFSQSGLTTSIDIGPGDLGAAITYKDSAAASSTNPTSTLSASVSSGGAIVTVPVTAAVTDLGPQLRPLLMTLSRFR